MGRFVLLLCVLSTTGCASPFNGRGLREVDNFQTGEGPRPGDWCVLQLTTESLGPMSNRLRFLRGRVEHIDADTVRLTDVMEENRVLSGPDAFRRLPYLSRLTSFDSDIELLESRVISRREIASWTVVSEAEVRQVRQSLDKVGDKWVQRRVGLDFDFNVPSEQTR